MIFNKNKNVRIRVAALIIEDERILLIAHKKNNDIYWLLPGGGVNFGESLTDALQREFKEELGAAISVNQVAMICDSIDPECHRHIVNICFYCSHKKGKYTLGNDKRLYDFGFFNDNEMQKLQIFPPISGELKNILNNSKIFPNIYLGKRWMTL